MSSLLHQIFARFMNYEWHQHPELTGWLWAIVLVIVGGWLALFLTRSALRAGIRFVRDAWRS